MFVNGKWGTGRLKRATLAAGTALALVLPCVSAGAQGVPDPAPADMRNFRIDPQPVPPAPPPPPAAETPVPAPAPVVDAVPTPAPTPPAAAPATTTRVRPRRVVRQAPPRNPRNVVAASPAPVVEAPAVEAPVAPAPDLPPATIVDPAPPRPVEASPVAKTPRGEEASTALLPIGIGLALAGLVGGLLWRRRRPVAVPVFDDAAPEIAPRIPPDDVVNDLPVEVATAPPVHVPEATIAPEVHAARPRLDIAFTPAAAGATDAVAAVDYSLIVTNSGDAPASKVRMEARLLAMGQDHDAALAAFFGGPLDNPTPIASAIPPGIEAALRAQVTLPRDAVNPIRVRDRTVFVPLVAFNVLYQWYDAQGGLQHGQTAMSYVVGRENRPPAAKMAPLRLDQGPRTYREVGQRAHQFRQLV